MPDDQMTMIQINIDLQTRRRLEAAKALCAFYSNYGVNPTWSDAVVLLASIVPIGQLLRDAIDGTTTTMGDVTGERTETERDDTGRVEAAGNDPAADRPADPGQPGRRPKHR